MRSSRRSNIIRYAIVIFMILAVILPFIPLVFTSFSFYWVYPDLLPDWSTRAWDLVFSQKAILDSIYHSVLIAAAVTALCFLIGFPASKAIGTRKFRYKTLAEILLLLPALVPALSLTMGVQWMFLRTPLYGTLAGMIIAQIVFALPYTIFCLSAVFKNYDLDHEDQARSLGANKLDVLVHITIPSIKNGMVVAAMYTFLVTWSQYLVIIMIGDPALKTLPVLIFNMIGGSDTALASALSIVFILPVLILLIFSAYILTKNKDPREG